MRKIFILLLAATLTLSLTACDEFAAPSNAARQDCDDTVALGNRLISNQPTPSDLEYSLERHNLIRRVYWVNGERERALMLPSPIHDMPLGYIILFAPNGGVVGRFVVEGKVTSLNSFLAPYSDYYEWSRSSGIVRNRWLPDVDGAFGENDGGIFFFTPDGRYIEWNGIYLYSDIPFVIDDPILRIENVEIIETTETED
jgi:hypothetical protein